jgi:hypothetical protein
MAVEVTINNNTSQTLFLTRNRYLEGSESFYTSKEQFICQFYSHLKDHLTSKLTNILGITTSLNLIGTILAISQFFVAWNSPPGDEQILLAFFALTGVSLGTIITNLIGLKTKKALNLAIKKEAELKNNIFYCRLNNPDTKFRFPTNKMYLEIPPQSKFHDIFFVDLRHNTRDLFDKNIPRLMYKTNQ